MQEELFACFLLLFFVVYVYFLLGQDFPHTLHDEL